MRRAMYSKGRQIGISHATAAACVVWGAFLGETTTVISVGERESIEVLDKAEKHAEMLVRLGSKWAVCHKKGTELQFASGGRIIALPSTSAGRSFTGNVVLDEFAYVENPKKLWDGAAAVSLRGYRMRVVSTPNGVGNDWHNLWTNPKANAGWAKHETTLEEAMADGMVVDIADCWAIAKGDPRLFDQLFRCKFLDGAEQYIPSEAIAACSSDDIYCTPECPAYGGLDIGRTADRTVLYIIRVDTSGLAHTIHIELRKRTSSDDLDALAELAFTKFRVRRLCVDATGLGAFPVERMQKRHGALRVEAVTFTTDSKEDLATTLYSRLTAGARKDGARTVYGPGLVVIPRVDKDLRDDLCALRRTVTSSGAVRYDAPVTDRGHADRAWALALALHGCTGPDRRRHES